MAVELSPALEIFKSQELEIFKSQELEIYSPALEIHSRQIKRGGCSKKVSNQARMGVQQFLYIRMESMNVTFF